MQSIKKAYLKQLKKRRKEGCDENIESLSHMKRGRPLLLGDRLDTMVQKYLKKVREGGGVVTARVAIAAARAIIRTQDRSQLIEFGGHIELTQAWAYSLLCRMKFVKRKATTAKSKFTNANFAQVKKEFLDDLAAVVEMEEIPPQLILNWDQTGIKLVPVSSHTMDRQGCSRVEVTGVTDKRLITALFCGSLTGDFLPVQVIYQGKTSRCHPKFGFPSDWNITHSRKHWSTEETMIEYIHSIIIPYITAQRELLGDASRHAAIIMDNFKGQVTDSVHALLEEHGIYPCLLPPNTTDRLQPLDVSVNKPAKDFLRRKFEEWYTDEVIKQLDGQDPDTLDIDPIDLRSAVIKEKSAQWLVDLANYLAENPHIIVNGFIKTGITAALDGTIGMDEDMEIEVCDDDDDDGEFYSGSEDSQSDETSSDSSGSDSEDIYEA